jgi:hypothetical protein
MKEDIPHFNLELSRQVHRVPLWVAVRWMLSVIFCGPNRAERHIRAQDRP